MNNWQPYEHLTGFLSQSFKCWKASLYVCYKWHPKYLHLNMIYSSYYLPILCSPVTCRTVFYPEHLLGQQSDLLLTSSEHSWQKGIPQSALLQTNILCGIFMQILHSKLFEISMRAFSSKTIAWSVSKWQSSLGAPAIRISSFGESLVAFF